MTRIAFVAAAMLVAAMGSASAGSDHYGSDGANQQTAGADHMMISSIRVRDVAHHQASVATGSGETVADMIAQHNGDGLWGK
ncbi:MULTISPECIES: DUF680 domain-containing protein [unclassified Mesorhizobium]|uniref:DUF680 domain-containing protein n=1 Tax=unclassified Mesorhizobium TaxID=325217 RepID=UPI000FCAA788|nr:MULTISPECIES: DUF680 domain-containing protein [unclassified Mesorhizobium]RUW31253.1 DUF680 domain-containing protein [Mesorhizobium sp. M1E.F.Ca.ET.041.01.1.1]RWD79208.1 MAG: DUF680 domain-containing protein [Mesorhizobium sp.]RWD81428.1 MAG: DUF680 domain-containing protein [Mesorhizobium sp.]TIV49092.1 MAG: DUF680 domain-containing protein [Mesorhizobium sp.]